MFVSHMKLKHVTEGKQEILWWLQYTLKSLLWVKKKRSTFNAQNIGAAEYLLWTFELLFT